MNNNWYDIFIIGHISLDEIIYKGVIERLTGGAVLMSSYAAAAGGSKVGVLTKVAGEDINLLSEFNICREDIYYVLSDKTTSIRNEFLSDDRERRNVTAISIADPFKADDIPDVKSSIYYFGGLIAGEFEDTLLDNIFKKETVAVDMQGFLRHTVDGRMFYKDWSQKEKYLPDIDFLKVDAAEAEVMTGYSDRREAAKALFDMGSREIMVTYNTEVLVYNGSNYYTVPFKHRNLSGRTGRGDTCFSSYVTERLKMGIEKSLLYAASLTSLKMETPGPFKGTRDDVNEYIGEFYG